MKKTIRSLILKISGRLVRSDDSKAIFYHDIAEKHAYTDMATPFEMFKKHIKTVQECFFTPVTAITNVKREVQICFDDGFRGLWDCREYLCEQDWKPTIFIAVELIGKPRYLNKTEILELQSLGVVFQGHSWSHKSLTQFCGRELKREILDSKKYLEQLLQKEVNELCFPIGHFSDEILEICHVAGYTKLYSSVPGNYYNQLSGNVIRRNLVQFYSPAEVKAVLNGALIPFAERYYKMHKK